MRDRDASTDVDIEIVPIHTNNIHTYSTYIHTYRAYHVELAHVASGQLSTALRAALKYVFLGPLMPHSLILLNHTHWQGCSTVGASQVEEAVVARVEYAVDRITDLFATLDLRLAIATATVQCVSLFGLLLS